MDDAIKSIKAHLYDRVVSPLFGAFIISWVVWNFRVILVLLSSEIIPYKLNYIDEYYSSIVYFYGISISKFWMTGVLSPLLSTFAYIYLYPFVALPVYEFSLSRQQKLANTKNKIEGATLLTLEKSRKIIQGAKKMQIEHARNMSEAEEEIESLRKIINEQLTEIEKLKGNPSVQEKSVFEGGDVDSPLVMVDEASMSEDDNGKDVLLQPEAAELEGYIIDTLFQKKVGDQFFFFNLIPSETWGHYSNERRYALEQSFKKGVASQRYKNVKVAEKQMEGVITKYEILDFPDYADASLVLIYILEKMAANKQKTVQLNELRAWRDWNYYLLKNGMEYLLSKGFVENVIHSGRPSCRMTKEGELFLAGSR